MMDQRTIREEYICLLMGIRDPFAGCAFSRTRTDCRSYRDKPWYHNSTSSTDWWWKEANRYVLLSPLPSSHALLSAVD
jgi:hypothetical protein